LEYFYFDKYGLDFEESHLYYQNLLLFIIINKINKWFILINFVRLWVLHKYIILTRLIKIEPYNNMNHIKSRESKLLNRIRLGLVTVLRHSYLFIDTIDFFYWIYTRIGCSKTILIRERSVESNPIEE
jgi:hypothetical protein